MARVELRGLTKRFGAVEAVAGATLDIAHGEFVVLVGPSGCGKSTTLRMIAGLEEATGGQILFDDKDVTDLTPAARDIAMVFQSYALYPHMNVAKNLGFGLAQRGAKRGEIEAAVARAAAMLGIADLLTRTPKELSGGQRQRVAMGRAIVRDPSVFLFDEPLSNLDAALRQQMRLEIRKLHRALATTVIYVTHDQIEAMTLADRIVVMNKGRIVQADMPLAIYERPVDKFVAGFIGAPRMNFLPCRVAAREDGVLVARIGDAATLPIDPALAACLLPFIGREMELGIRPEHLAEAAPDQADIVAMIEAVEPTGADTLVIVTLAGADIAARCSPRTRARPGESIGLSVDATRLHFVDPDTGLIIYAPA